MFYSLFQSEVFFKSFFTNCSCFPLKSFKRSSVYSQCFLTCSCFEFKVSKCLLSVLRVSPELVLHCRFQNGLQGFLSHFLQLILILMSSGFLTRTRRQLTCCERAAWSSSPLCSVTVGSMKLCAATSSARTEGNRYKRIREELRRRRPKGMSSFGN